MPYEHNISRSKIKDLIEDSYDSIQKAILIAQCEKIHTDSMITARNEIGYALDEYKKHAGQG
jgi:hypothetical protein